MQGRDCAVPELLPRVPAVIPARLLVVLAFTGVPSRQLRPDRGACNGRWDEVFRSLLAAKQRCRDTSVAVVVLVEAVEEGSHLGIASVVLTEDRLRQVEAAREMECVALFGEWAARAPVSCDCASALLSSFDVLYGQDALDNVAVSLFASPDDSVAQQFSQCAVSCPSPLERQLDLCVKVFGGPCHWAQKEETRRMPLLAAALQQRFQVPVSLVHLGRTRLRVSQALLCEDGVRPYEEARKGITRVPRVAYRLSLGQGLSVERVAELAHHFLVECMWFEQRRDTPRHHVTLCWTTSEGEEREASVSSKAMEDVRGDRELKAQRRSVQKIKETGATMECFVPQWLALLSQPSQPANRSIKLLCCHKCESVEQLEVLTAAVVRWELQHLV